MSNISGAGYCCFVNRISKDEAVNLLQIADLTEKIGTLLIIIFLYRL